MTDDGTFERVRHSDTPMYGTRKLLLCGFPAPAQPQFRTIIERAGLTDLPLVWADEDQVSTTLAMLLALSDGSGQGRDSHLPRAIIVSGITENQLHTLMNACRSAGMRQALWAALTPTSENWSLGQLLEALEAERRCLAQGPRP